MLVEKSLVEGCTILEGDKVTIARMETGYRVHMTEAEANMLCAILSNVAGELSHPIRKFSNELFFQLQHTGLSIHDIASIQDKIEKPMMLKRCI